MPGTNLILDAAGNWPIEKFMVNRISPRRGVDHPPRAGIGAGVRILALFFCYFELANNLSDRSHVCENVCLDKVYPDK